MPFAWGIILPYLFPIFHFHQSIVIPTIGKHPVVPFDYLTIVIVFPPGLLFFMFYYHYRLAFADNYFEKRGYQIAINEYDYINKVLYIEVVLIIILTLLFYTLPPSMKEGYLSPLLGDGFYFLQATLIITVYITFFTLSFSYGQRDFRFQFAKACMNVIENKKDEVNKIYYLMLGLDSYNKFLKRNIKLQFDDTMVCSKIISSSEKNQSLNLITASFKDNDKLKPVSCLSNIIKLPDKGQFLVKKPLKGKIKDAVTILTAIIPIVISILQLMFPKYFQMLLK